LQAAPLLVHFFKAVFLRRDFYESVAADSHATRPAIAFVCLSTLAYVGTLMPVDPWIQEIAEKIGYWILPPLVAIEVGDWAIFAAIAWIVGRLFVKQRPDFARLARCLGFARAPLCFSLVFLLDPTTGTWLGRVLWLWLFVASIVAVRAAFATTYPRALATAALSYGLDYAIPQLIALGLLRAIHGQ
jgi:hypothetical protein